MTYALLLLVVVDEARPLVISRIGKGALVLRLGGLGDGTESSRSSRERRLEQEAHFCG